MRGRLFVAMVAGALCCAVGPAARPAQRGTTTHSWGAPGAIEHTREQQLHAAGDPPTKSPANVTGAAVVDDSEDDDDLVVDGRVGALPTTGRDAAAVASRPRSRVACKVDRRPPRP